MNGVVWCHPAGSKLGNASMGFLHAYAHAKRVGATFVCTPWIGEQVFRLPEYGRSTKACEAFPVRSELDLREDETNVRITGYAQNEKATRIYTKDEAIEWLKPRREESDILKYFRFTPHQRVAAHLRRGDYIGYGYPMVSMASYDRAIAHHKLNAHLSYNFETFLLISELCPQVEMGLPPQLSFLTDFTIMQTSSVLLRSNSSFSWLAGLLSKGRVFSPVITPDMKGGVEHDCAFIEGNWPRLSCLEGCGDLKIKGET
jgi:hypothetical protein